MSNTTELALFREAEAALFGGKDSNADGWMTFWCNANWGDLLQPAPQSLAWLGSIMVIASSTDDFSLVEAPHPGVKPFDWQYALKPDSFQACLRQMVRDSCKAFENTHKYMEVISLRTEAMPNLIREAIENLNNASPPEIESLLPVKIEALVESCNAALAAGKACESAFDNLRGLANEMTLACRNWADSAEQVHPVVLKAQREGDKQASTHANLQELRRVLFKAVGAFDALRTHSSHLVQLFTGILDLLSDVLRPSLDDFVEKISRGKELVLAGVELSNFVKCTISNAMFLPMRASILASRIAGTYINVSAQYITPALRQVGTLMSFIDSVTPAQHETYAERGNLTKQASEASEKILALVQQDQKQFSADIDARIKKIQDATKQAFPTVTQQPPKHITAVIETHVGVKKFEAVKNPEFVTSGMVTTLSGDTDF